MGKGVTWGENKLMIPGDLSASGYFHDYPGDVPYQGFFGYPGLESGFRRPLIEESVLDAEVFLVVQQGELGSRSCGARGAVHMGLPVDHLP